MINAKVAIEAANRYWLLSPSPRNISEKRVDMFGYLLRRTQTMKIISKVSW